ncbi:ParA family protein, partial [Rhizobium johnstonii]
SDERLSRVVALINGKGGVGKTSTTANISGQLARANYQVLAVDLDLSGNLKLDLGYVGNPLDDDGKGVVDAVWHGQALPVIKNVRENLD